MGDLRVRLLGGLDVDGLRPVEIGSRKARTLLAALATPPRQPRPADLLAEVLWGDELPSRPADQVGVLVSRLRRTLGADRIGRVDAGYLLAPDWVDVDELGDRAAAARDHLAAGDPVPARLAAAMALDLARGPLLPEEDSPWFDAARAAVSRSVAAAGLVAAEAALSVGDPLGAVAAANQCLDHDPYDEAALRLLMEAHRAAGRPASALSAYAAMRARLRDDLGVSPDPRTEAVHDAILGVDPGPGPATVGTSPEPVRPVTAERFEPLVQRARVELASNDLTSARRDAEEAVRRGGGPGALELAGWTAYYARDFPAALRWAEEGAARSAEPERRASCLTLAARVRHSGGDLHGAESHLQEAIQCEVTGVRAMAQVWLAALRSHQGRPEEALELARAGSVDEAALRHPFIIVHAQFAQAYALGELARVADALTLIDGWDAMLAEMGAVGVRYQAAAANMRAWILGAIGERTEAEASNQLALRLTNTHEEPRNHALLDLAQLAVRAGEPAAARRWLDRVEVPSDEAGAMAWHQRQRMQLLRAQLSLLDADPEAALADASAVVEDASGRGSRRAELLARATVAEAQLRSGRPVDPAAVDALLAEMAQLAGMERWRIAAQLAAASDHAPWWDRATAWGADLAAACGDRSGSVQRWVAAELARLRSA